MGTAPVKKQVSGILFLIEVPDKPLVLLLKEKINQWPSHPGKGMFVEVGVTRNSLGGELHQVGNLIKRMKEIANQLETRKRYVKVNCWDFFTLGIC